MSIETRSFELEELRAIDEANPRRLVGLAVVYGQLADIGGKFYERVNPGALTRSLSSGRDIKARFEHRDLLASTSNGTLQLRDTDRGLEVSIDVAKTRAGDDVLELVRRGDIKGMSFGFNVPRDGQKFTRDAGRLVRDLIDLNLFEVTVTDRPAYAGTDIAQRSVDPWAFEEAKRLTALPTLADRKMQLRRLVAAA